MSKAYAEFIARKKRFIVPKGLEPRTMPKHMRPDQKDVTKRAIEMGRYAIFADCGLGKTVDELEWASQVARTGLVLLVAPLCVGVQTAQMGKRFGYDVNICKEPKDVKDGINITNYDRLQKFEGMEWKGIGLDESSILKNVDGKLRSYILSEFRRVPNKLAATATPAPNDHMELGNHAEFLGICTREEMLAEYFTHDGGDTAKWRIKGHAVKAFWDWVGSWSVAYKKPSDLNPKYSDKGFNLPALETHEHILGDTRAGEGMLFDAGRIDLSAHRDIRRSTIDIRIQKCVELCEGDKSPWVFWCELNDEGDMLESSIKGCQQLKGVDDIDKKEEILWAFTNGQIDRLVTKYKITSFGLNWQHCHKTAFVGATHSYESVYQAIKRFHRFGQEETVQAHFIMMDSEYTVFQNLQRKFKQQGAE